VTTIANTLKRESEGISQTKAISLQADPAVSERLALFATGLSFDDLPVAVVDQAKRCLIDSIGVAFASGAYDFARRALSALAADNSGGSYPVIGFKERLGRRDSAFFNGILIHGLDFDDTHVPGVVHASSSALPAAMAIGVERHLSGRDFLTGYVLGLEVTSRLGMGAGGEFHQVGFHPTGLLGAFGAATLAARLQDLPPKAIVMAQGIVGSMAAGSLVFLESGAWTKRLHPGWAAAAGLVAASLAAEGFVGPERIYEGRFGLFRSHLGSSWDGDATSVLDGLGDRWEMLRIALKPFPACHFTHAFADAALSLRREGLRADEIATLECLIGAGEVGTVCEPAQAKKQPRTDYEAKFSLPYVVAASLLRGKLTLAEFDQSTIFDPEVMDLASRITYRVDPDSGFPHHYSGEIVVTTTNGRVLREREQVNRGAEERPLTDSDVAEKFRNNVTLVRSASFADRIVEVLNSVEMCTDVVQIAEVLRG